MFLIETLFILAGLVFLILGWSLRSCVKIGDGSSGNYTDTQRHDAHQSYLDQKTESRTILKRGLICYAISLVLLEGAIGFSTVNPYVAIGLSLLLFVGLCLLFYKLLVGFVFDWW